MRKLLATLLITPAMAQAQTDAPARLTGIHAVQDVANLPEGVFYAVTTGVLTVLPVSGEADGFSPTEILMGPDGLLYGIDPGAALVEGRDGRLYGTTIGFNTSGTVFEVAFVPEAPANLIASATSTSGTADGEVRLNWDPVRDAISYDVYRGTTSGGLTLWSPGAALTTTNALVTGLTPGVRYYFAVVAVNEAGTSARSAEASAIPTGLAPVGGGVRVESSGGGGSLGLLMLALLSVLLAGVRTFRSGLRATRT